MKHYHEFSRSGHTFAERIGDPTEVDAAFGMIARNSPLLEDMVRGIDSDHILRRGSLPALRVSVARNWAILVG